MFTCHNIKHKLDTETDGRMDRQTLHDRIGHEEMTTHSYSSGWWSVDHQNQRCRTGCHRIKITLNVLL